MDSNVEAMASNLEAVASTLVAMASNLIANLSMVKINRRYARTANSGKQACQTAAECASFVY